MYFNSVLFLPLSLENRNKIHHTQFEINRTFLSANILYILAFLARTQDDILIIRSSLTSTKHDILIIPTFLTRTKHENLIIPYYLAWTKHDILNNQ